MAKYVITEANNFIRIFQVPVKYPSGYCFGGGIPTVFTMVDWFNPVSPTELWEAGGKKELGEHDVEDFRHNLCGYIVQKPYYDPARSYFAITDYGDIFWIEPVVEGGPFPWCPMCEKNVNYCICPKSEE